MSEERMRRNFLGLLSLAAAVAFAACTKDPTSSLRGGTARVSTSLRYTVVTVGDSTVVTATALDEQGNPLAEVPTVTSSTPNLVTIIEVSAAPLSQKKFYIKAVGYGVGKVIVTAGAAADTITVQT